MDKITTDELMELFGEAIPMSAVSVIMGARLNDTPDDTRAKLKEIAANNSKPHHGLERREAFWTHDDGGCGDHLYYFAPKDRAPPPYVRQRRVTAILDLASDGTLAGVELVFGDRPPPPIKR